MANDKGDSDLQDEIEEKVKAYDPVNITEANYKQVEKMGEDSGLREVLAGFLGGQFPLPYTAKKVSHLIADSVNIPLFPNPWERRILEGAVKLLLATIRKQIREGK